MNETQERDARLQKIVDDVKASWGKPRVRLQKMSKAEKRLLAAPSEPRPPSLPPDELLPLIEAKKTTREKLVAKFKKCQSCGRKDNLTVEHIVPVAILKLFGIRRMSSYSYEKHKKNLTLLCTPCNSKKGSSVDLNDKKVKRILLWYIKNHNEL